MMGLWRRLDPRLHLAAAVGWAVFVVVTLAALLAAGLAAHEAERRVRDDSQRLLTQFALQIDQALTMNLVTRRAIVQATAAQIEASADRSRQALRRHLEAVQAQFPEFAWLGVADAKGRITAATGDVMAGEDAAGRAWFVQGRDRVVVSGVQQAPASEATGLPQRYIDVAVPLAQHPGGPAGVLGARLSWAWFERLQAEQLRALDAHRRLDLLWRAGDGTVLAGPAAWLGRPLPAGTDLSQGGRYLVGQAARQAPLEGAPGGGWSLVVRQDAATALALARATRQQVFLSVVLAGWLAAAAAVGATRVLMRRLSHLAAQAQGVRSGTVQALAVPQGRDEVSRIGATLAQVVGHLQQEKQALQTLNAELDARVAERTARIERLADDARHAAVTRERLRLARDLHDTLAHSLMALLTQIRLVRKLRTRLADAELEAELASAEAVAASGLTEARAAITQMRHNGVREAGLGPALQELVGRFRAHTGVAATWQADPAAADLANSRAETVFRMAEEALRNVERHAQAHHLAMTLEQVASGADEAGAAPPDEPGAERHWRLTIADDGVGFDPAVPVPGHYGLRGIEEQAVLIGARLALYSQPGQGTRLVIAFDA